MIRKVRNCCETCENLVSVATTIGQLHHTEYLKPTFLDTFKWAIRLVFPETVTYYLCSPVPKPQNCSLFDKSAKFLMGFVAHVLIK